MSIVQIRPPFVALGYLTVALGSRYFFADPQLIYPPYHYFGILFLGCGALLAVSALGLFKKKETTYEPFGTPAQLIVSGPFRFTRNPMYLGLTLFLLGIAFLIGSLFLLLVPVAFFLTMNAYYAPREEKLLEKLFGEEFTDYKARVRRWV